MTDFFLELWNTGGILAIVALVLAVISYLQYLMGKMRDENQKMIRDFATSEAEERKALQSRLDSTETSFDAERSAWDTERKTFLDDRERLKTELERSLTNEADMETKIKGLTGDIEKLRLRINDLEAERKADKIEKEQLIRDAKIVQNELKQARHEKGDLIKQRTNLEFMIADHRTIVDDLRKRVEALEEGLRQKDHELSRAYGTISALTTKLMKFTDDTQPIPSFDEIENAGNDDEVITPVVNMELNLQETEDTTIVTPVESPTDNVTEDNEPKKGAA